MNGIYSTAKDQSTATYPETASVMDEQQCAAACPKTCPEPANVMDEQYPAACPKTCPVPVGMRGQAATACAEPTNMRSQAAASCAERASMRGQAATCPTSDLEVANFEVINIEDIDSDNTEFVNLQPENSKQDSEIIKLNSQSEFVELEDDQESSESSDYESSESSDHENETKVLEIITSNTGGSHIENLRPHAGTSGLSGSKELGSVAVGEHALELHFTQSKLGASSLAHVEACNALALYCQMMRCEIQDDESVNELEVLHQTVLNIVLEEFDQKTKKLPQTTVEVYREELLQDVSKQFSKFLESVQKRVKELVNKMPLEMRRAREEILLQFQTSLLKTFAAVETEAEMDDAYSTCEAQALDTLNRWIEQLEEELEDHHLPIKLLTSELSCSFEQMKRQHCATLLEQALRRAKAKFQDTFTTECEKLTNTHTLPQSVEYIPVQVQALHVAMTTTLSSFEAETVGLIKANVELVRRRLQKELLLESRIEPIKTYVTEERTQCMELYKHAMEAECTNPAIIKKQHEEAVSTVTAHFHQKTKELPACLVESAQALLLQAMEVELSQFMQRAEQKVLVDEESQLKCALDEACNYYINQMDKAEQETDRLCETDIVQDILKTTHTSARAHALKTYSMLTVDVAQDKVSPGQIELDSEIEKLWKSTLSRVEKREHDRLIAEAVESAYETYNQAVTTSNDEEGAVALVPLEERHTSAMTVALDTFDALTESFHLSNTTFLRNVLMKRMDAAYSVIASRELEEQLRTEEKRALDSFRAAMGPAVHGSNACVKRNCEIRKTTLDQFDEATSLSYSPEQVAVSRKRLEESMDISLNLIKEVRNSVGDARDCIICSSRRSNMAFIPCGHIVCCEQCGRRLSTCCSCRSSINDFLKVYI